MQLENFDEALAVAPKVSMKYWQKCLDSYRQNLNSEITSGSSCKVNASQKGTDPVEQYIEYSILGGDYDAAAKILENNKKSKAAKTVKFVQLAGSFPSQKVIARHEAANIQDSNAPPPIPLFELGPNQQELKSFTDQEAFERFQQGEPLLSAAIHLSLGDTKGAL